MLCALRTLAISDVRNKNFLCFFGSSAMARSSSNLAWRAAGSRSSSRFLLAMVCSWTDSMLLVRRLRV